MSAAAAPIPRADHPESVAPPKADTPAAQNFLQQTSTRAMWLWNEPPGSRAIVANRDGAQDKLIAFLRAPHGKTKRSINRLFFAARAHAGVDVFEKPRPVIYDPLLNPAAQPALRKFLTRLDAAGVAVEFLAGQAIWLATGQYAEVPKQICRDVVAFNLSSDDPSARFDGIHLDIEPHTVVRGSYAGQWWQNRLENGYNAEWTRRWRQILSSCRQTLDAYEARTGHHLTLASDVGSDFARYNGVMFEFLNRSDGPLDYVGVLNYFDPGDNREGRPTFFFGAYDGERIVGGVRENLAKWTLPVLFGLETGPESIAPDSRSFHQEGYMAMYRTIDKLLSEYGSTNCIGVAIHHYGPHAYRDMKP
jgi:hypothetical protein